MQQGGSSKERQARGQTINELMSWQERSWQVSVFSVPAALAARLPAASVLTLWWEIDLSRGTGGIAVFTTVQSPSRRACHPSAQASLGPVLECIRSPARLSTSAIHCALRPSCCSVSASQRLSRKRILRADLCLLKLAGVSQSPACP